MSEIVIETLYPGYRVVYKTRTRVGHVTGDYLVGFTAYGVDGQRGRIGQHRTPAAAYEALVNPQGVSA